MWNALLHDGDLCVTVCDRDGNILFSNEISEAWRRWEMAHASSQAPIETPAEGCADVTDQIRLEIRRRVCDEGSSFAYESFCHGMRHRISVRPLEQADGSRVALVVCRRMHPWERVEPDPATGTLAVDVPASDPGIIATLSPRELEVMILIGEGLSYAEIGKRLHRSVRTIERHRDRLGQKLGATNRVQIARFAIRAGLCELPIPPDEARFAETPYDPLELSAPVREVARRRTKRSQEV
ncbi:MAG: helix-turn-helix transcriptional regulator [Phycisphaerales bacterium]|nr:helix-turn-helix transcriptional regulator [Phycisphaerales bacterium]